MAGHFLVLTVKQVTRHISRRHAQAAHAGKKGVSVVLADTSACGKRLGGAGIDCGAAGAVGHVLVKGAHQFDQRRTITLLAAELAGESAQGFVRLGQASEAQKGQR
ncbi:hypothetical protein D3C77_583670 [compost metagenome]